MALQTQVFKRLTSNRGLWQLSAVSVHHGSFLLNEHKTIITCLLLFGSLTSQLSYVTFVILDDNTAF